MNDDELEKKLDEIVKHHDTVVLSPKTIEMMKAKGLPIKSVKVAYKDYLDKLFMEKRKTADSIVNDLPHLDPTIANASISSLYDEFRSVSYLVYMVQQLLWQ